HGRGQPFAPPDDDGPVLHLGLDGDVDAFDLDGREGPAQPLGFLRRNAARPPVGDDAVLHGGEVDPGGHVGRLQVQENSEGEYAGIGGRLRQGGDDEVAIQTTVFTRKGVERVMRYAFEEARRRPRKLLACATKSNALNYTM